MVDARSTYAIELKDETSGSAANAANALAELKGKIDDDVRALRQMQGALRNMKGNTAATATAAKTLRDRIEAQKASIASAQSRYVELGGTFGRLPPKINATGTSLRGLLGQLTSVAGISAAGGPVVAGILAVTAVFVGLTAAVAATTAAILRYGIAQRNARRDELLQLEGLTTLRNYYGIAAGSGTELQAAIDRVSGSAVQGRGEINAYAQQLYRMGMRGENLSQALEGVALAGAVQGERGARRFMGLAAGIARTGGEVRKLTDDYKARLGPIARRMSMSLGVQTRKLKEDLGALFDGVEIEGFLSALREVTHLFSQTTQTGRSLRQLVEIIFQPMTDALGGLGPVAKRFFQGMIIGAQELVILVLRLAIWFKRAFGSSELLAGIDAQNAALALGKGALFGILAAATLAGVAFAALAASIAMVAAPLVLAMGAATAFGAAIGSAVAWFQATDFKALGKSMVDGLVNGITAGASRLVSAIRGLASTARDAFASAMDIRSPSRVFAGLGVQLPAGVEEGIEAGSPSLAGAVERMVSIPADTGGPYRSAPAGQTSVSIGDIYVQSSGESADRIAVDIRDELARVLEGVAITMGAPA